MYFNPKCIEHFLPKFSCTFSIVHIFSWQEKNMIFDKFFCMESKLSVPEILGAKTLQCYTESRIGGSFCCYFAKKICRYITVGCIACLVTKSQAFLSFAATSLSDLKPRKKSSFSSRVASDQEKSSF